MNGLIIFTRYPTPGKTKTRLIPVLGEHGAASLQRQMTEYTLRQTEELLTFFTCSIEVHFVGATLQQMKNWLGERFVYYPQKSEGDLGYRLEYAIDSAFKKGIKKLIIIGIDCPELNSSLLFDAYKQLENHDIVLGPATDGGYYLLGLRFYWPELFQGIDWGTSKVFQQTCNIAKNLGCSIATLQTCSDIDYPEDLPLWFDFSSG